MDATGSRAGAGRETMTRGRGHDPVRRRRLAVAVAAALAMAAGSGAAAAQEPDGPATLDAIVVTANKRVEDERKVASSITVVGQATLENLGVRQLTDISDYVPGLQVQSAGTPGLTSVSMRGIAALSSSTTVGTYVDEVPLGSSGLYQSTTTLVLDLLPYDIARVEALRGPQGTLYGAGAMGGLLKYVTVEPDLGETSFRIGGGINSVRSGTEGWNLRVGANLPLARDRLGVRLSYARNEIPGFVDNAIDGRRNINEGTQASARAALLWQGEASSARFTAMRQTIDTDDRAAVALDPATYRPVTRDLEDRLWVSRPFEKDIDLLSLTIDRDLGWADFVSATAWSDTWTFNRLDATVQFGEVANLLLGLPEPGRAFVDYGLELDKLTQEFRLTSKSGGVLEWMVGAFYTREKANQSQFVPLTQLDGSPLPPPLDQVAGVLARLELPSQYKETALFANFGWRIGDRFKIDAGLRQSRNDQRFTQNVTEGILVPIGESPGGSSENVFTWSLSPQFQLNDQVLLYAKAATGYQPGGPNVVAPGLPASVDSSTLTSYELGMKSQFAGNRVLFDLIGFRIEWDDIQVGTSVDGIGGLVNGGEATSEGLELTTSFRPTDKLQLGINAAWTRASLKRDFQTVVVQSPPVEVQVNAGLAGDRMPYVPRLAWSATAEYGFDVGASWRGRVGGAFRHVGSRVSGTTDRQRVVMPGTPPTVLDEAITPPLDVPAYRALDLYLGVDSGSWAIRAYVNNVTDRRGYSSITAIDGALTGVVSHLNAVPIRPRTFGVELDYRF